MRFPGDLVPATLIRRYKRFLADVELSDGSTTTVHVANPGGMTGLQMPGARVWLSRSPSKTRKLPLSWELVEADLGGGMELVGVNTGYSNAIVAEALAAGTIPELAGYAAIRREVKYGDGSRIDFVLEAPDRPACYVEVKNVTLMRQPGLAEFPDAVTARGTRHLNELAVVASAGLRAVMLFVVQIGSATQFGLARDIDPAYARAFDHAVAAGVEVLVWRCHIDLTGISLGQPVILAASGAANGNHT